MKRRFFLMGLTGAAMAAMQALPAFAASYAEDVVGQLAGLGYENITIEATWLGRIRILATRSDGAREIVLNPRTGEILRDVWTPTSGDGVRRVILDALQQGSGRTDLLDRRVDLRDLHEIGRASCRERV